MNSILARIFIEIDFQYGVWIERIHRKFMDYIESWLPSLSLEECEQYMYGQIFARAKLKYVFTSTKFIRKQEEMHLQKALSFFKEARASTTYILSVKNTVIYDSDNDEEA